MPLRCITFQDDQTTPRTEPARVAVNADDKSDKPIGLTVTVDDGRRNACHLHMTPAEALELAHQIIYRVHTGQMTGRW